MRECNIYHFKHTIHDDELDMLHMIHKKTTLDPSNDIGDYMIDAALRIVPRINGGLYSYGVVVCLRDGFRCIGAILYSYRDGNCIIHKMGISGEFRSRGIGSMLLSHLKHYLTLEGAINISLYSVDDERAIAFYERHRFVPQKTHINSTHMEYVFPQVKP